MRIAIIVGTLALGVIGGGGISYDAPVGGGIGTGGTVLSGTIKVNDDIDITFGTDSDYTAGYDSGNGRYELRSTNIDGGGTDGDIFRVAEGQRTVSFLGGVSVTGNITANGKMAHGSGTTVTVDGATTFAVQTNYHVLACTGNETINTITGGVTGMVLYLENSDTECTIADDDTPTAADAIDLTGAATTDVGAAAKVLVLLYNGASWLEVGESDN